MHKTITRVRFGETDLMGVVYHPNYLVYFETGRTELLRSAYKPYSEIEASGIRLVVVDVGLHYRAPARYDELIEIETQVSDVSGATIRFEYRVCRPQASDEPVLLTEGYTVLACVNTSGRPRRIPTDFRDALNAEQAAVDV